MPSTIRKDCPKTQEITSGLRFGERKQETTPSKPGQRAARVQVQAPWLSYAVHSRPTLSLGHGAQDGASHATHLLIVTRNHPWHFSIQCHLFKSGDDTCIPQRSSHGPKWSSWDRQTGSLRLLLWFESQMAPAASCFGCLSLGQWCYFGRLLTLKRRSLSGRSRSPGIGLWRWQRASSSAGAPCILSPWRVQPMTHNPTAMN